LRALGGRRIAVVDTAEEFVFRKPERCKGIDIFLLILCEGFCWEEIKGCCDGIVERCLKDGQVIAKRFPAGSAGDDDNVFTQAKFLPALMLVRIKLIDAFAGEVVFKDWVKFSWQGRKTRGMGGPCGEMGDVRRDR